MMQAALGEWESPWRELGVPADADPGTIKKAYRKLVLQCEPFKSPIQEPQSRASYQEPRSPVHSVGFNPRTGAELKCAK